MNRYKIDIPAFITDLLPSFRRNSAVLLAFLRAACAHILDLHDEFLSWGREKQREILWNAQTIKLRRLLRNRYASEGIEIENLTIDTNGAFIGTDNDAALYIGMEADADLYIGTAYSLEDVNFIVKVPASVSFDHTEMQAVINKYKTVGTKFLIKVY